MSTETNTPSPDAMNVISDTLEPVIDTWDDPGVYPSGAGGYRLPSRRYVEYVDGSITIDLTAENLIYAIEQEMWGPLELETRPKIRVKKWHAAKLAVIDGKIQLQLEVEDFDADDIEDEAPEREYGDDGEL